MLDVSTLNEAQREAVTAGEGPLLVIAGAGSGKTRTIVYRLAWLVEQGCDASSMLLLTFTRKAAQEMLDRASILLEQQLMGVQGGTFHAFAFSVLRRWQPEWLLERGAGLSVMDSADSASAISTGICESSQDSDCSNRSRCCSRSRSRNCPMTNSSNKIGMTSSTSIIRYPIHLRPLFSSICASCHRRLDTLRL